MALPSLSKFFPEMVGKPVTDFTLEDWQTVAYEVATFANELMAELCPPQKKRGRPKIVNHLNSAHFLSSLSRRASRGVRGRPRQDYYGLPLEAIAEIVEYVSKEVASPEAREKWPRAPRTKRYVLDTVLRVLKNRSDGYHDPRAVERALRRFRADKNQG